MNLRRLLYRSWFYFRQGYGTYISLPVGIASNLVVLYELAVIKNKILSPVFISLTVFTLAALLVFVPISILFGLYHMKRTGAYAADASVSTESNPYMYKIIPGKEQEVLYPLILLTAKGLTKLLDQQRTVTDSERRELEEIMAKAQVLLTGQPVGLPKRMPTSELSR